MKKTISIMTALCLSFSAAASFVRAENDIPEVENNSDYLAQISQMIRQYDSDKYFSAMSVTIGEPELVIDGKTTAIDESGSVPYIEKGRTMMPVRGIAEAMGADVSFDNDTYTVTVEDDDVVIEMTIGEDEMNVNGESVMLMAAPEIKESRTMLPVRDMAEALDCEVNWDAETMTATFTRPYQTKRIVVNSENADTTGAVASVCANGKTIIQFDSISAAKECAQTNRNLGYIAEPDYVRTLSAMSWGANDVGGNTYYSETDYAAGSAVVAVIDTGIDYNHECFRGRIVDGYDFFNCDNYCEDVMEHGTMVASTVLDIAGSNQNIKIMPLKVFGDYGSATTITIAEAIRYAADYGANVINMSIGGEHSSSLEQEAIDYANSKNVAVVASAGNESLDLEVNDYAPGGLNGVITVSAIDTNYRLATFSNYGSGIVEFTAPGVGIRCAKAGGGYTSASGTSFSAPHVAAVYALAKAVHPDALTTEITEALSSNARSLGNSRYYGAGLIRAAGLETHLSSMYFSDVRAQNITDTNAVITGTIGYTGIIPEYIGVKIGSKKVYSTSFVNNGRNEMQFVCDLSANAAYKLSPNTSYEYCIFTDQGCHTLVTDKYTFATTPSSGTPEPAPSPTPGASELRILPENYPTGTHTTGKSFYLSGSITSNYHITDVRSYILDENMNILQESSGWTTTSRYIIKNSNLDTGLKFSSLSAGKYYLRYYAADESGNSVTWTSDPFTVGSSNTGSNSSALRILPENYPTGTHTIGKSFYLSGSITSNYHITDVRSYILDENMNILQESSGWTTTSRYIIKNSNLDTGLKFSSLSAGKYYLRYYAADESGNSVTWTSDPFTVGSSSTGSNSSALRILPEKYPTGTHPIGKSFYLSGRIKSDCHITDVRSYILDANKNVVMEANGWTTTQTYVIEGSALDNGMKFSALARGGYYLRYTASDESGNTVSWTSDMFYIG